MAEEYKTCSNCRETSNHFIDSRGVVSCVNCGTVKPKGDMKDPALEEFNAQTKAMLHKDGFDIEHRVTCVWEEIRDEISIAFRLGWDAGVAYERNRRGSDEET